MFLQLRGTVPEPIPGPRRSLCMKHGKYFWIMKYFQRSHVARCRRFGCAVVAHQGKIYVGGGFGQDKAILCSVETYDPDTDKVMQNFNLFNYNRIWLFAIFEIENAIYYFWWIFKLSKATPASFFLKFKSQKTIYLNYIFTSTLFSKLYYSKAIEIIDQKCLEFQIFW